jgi:hypothetical protein
MLGTCCHLAEDLLRSAMTAANGYDDEQLSVILTLFDRLHEITQAEIARLRDT